MQLILIDDIGSDIEHGYKSLHLNLINIHCKALHNASHEKTDLKGQGFVVVIPKEGCAHPSLGMTPTFREYDRYEVKRLKF